MYLCLGSGVGEKIQVLGSGVERSVSRDVCRFLGEISWGGSWGVLMLAVRVLVFAFICV